MFCMDSLRTCSTFGSFICFGFVGRMVVDSLIEGCFFLGCSSRETFLSNLSLVSGVFTQSDWPIMASDAQPCRSRFNLWMLYVDYGFTLVALGRFEEASILACGPHPKHPKAFWRFDRLPWLSCGWFSLVGESTEHFGKAIEPLEKGLLRFLTLPCTHRTWKV